MDDKQCGFCEDGNTKYYWGKFKMVDGKMGKVWSAFAMTRQKMLEWDDTYRHMSRIPISIIKRACVSIALRAGWLAGIRPQLLAEIIDQSNGKIVRFVDPEVRQAFDEGHTVVNCSIHNTGEPARRIGYWTKRALRKWERKENLPHE